MNGSWFPEAALVCASLQYLSGSIGKPSSCSPRKLILSLSKTRKCPAKFHLTVGQLAILSPRPDFRLDNQQELFDSLHLYHKAVSLSACFLPYPPGFSFRKFELLAANSTNGNAKHFFVSWPNRIFIEASSAKSASTKQSDKWWWNIND